MSNDDFENLFKTHFKLLCFYAVRMVKDMDTARDITHEAFIALWEKRDEIDPTKSVKSYLTTSVHNKCLNYLRDNKKFDRNLLTTENLATMESSSGSSEEIITAELSHQIKDAIQSLPEKCREVFLLSREENLKYSEIAEKLGISVKTVEVQMSKALKILREKLADYIPLLLILIQIAKNR